MKVIVKDKEGETIFESSEGIFVDIKLDDYDIYRMRSHDNSTIPNDIKSISIVRMKGAPSYKDD